MVYHGILQKNNMGIWNPSPTKNTRYKNDRMVKLAGGGFIYTDDPHDTTTQFESKISSVSQEYPKTQNISMIFSRKTIS